MTTGRLANKSALITGGASGVGRATALRFAEEGVTTVGLFDRDATRLDVVAEEVRLRGANPIVLVGDVTSRESAAQAVASILQACGRLDILVSNAGVDGSASILEMTDEEWHRVIDVNLNASFRFGQLAARAMVADGKGGCIFFTASISGMGASEGDAHYGVSKAGVINLVRTMSMELVDHGIRVNCVSPGPLDTPLSRELLGSDEAMAAAREHWPLVPMQRLGLPEEIAGAYTYLASADGAYTTGQNLVVDGGLTARVYTIPDEVLGG